MNIIATAAIEIAGAAGGFTAGWFLRPFLLRHRGIDELQPYLDKVVNTEGHQEYRNAMRRQLHDAKRRTMRFDGGAPATVHRMRRKRRGQRTME